MLPNSRGEVGREEKVLKVSQSLLQALQGPESQSILLIIPLPRVRWFRVHFTFIKLTKIKFIILFSSLGLKLMLLGKEHSQRYRQVLVHRIFFHRKAGYKNSSRSTKADGLVECLCKWEENHHVVWALSHILSPPTVLKESHLIERAFSEGVGIIKCYNWEFIQLLRFPFFPVSLFCFRVFIQPYVQRHLIKKHSRVFVESIPFNEHLSKDTLLIQSGKTAKLPIFFRSIILTWVSLRLRLASAHGASRGVEVMRSFTWGFPETSRLIKSQCVYCLVCRELKRARVQ